MLGHMTCYKKSKHLGKKLQDVLLDLVFALQPFLQ